jgi:hypothetical protein
MVAGTEQPAWFPDDWLTEKQPGYVPSSWLVRRSALERIGTFDEHYDIACDSDWISQFNDAGLRSELLPDALATWRVHGANGSYDRATMRRELFEVFRRSIRRRETAGGRG